MAEKTMTMAERAKARREAKLREIAEAEAAKAAFYEAKQKAKAKKSTRKTTSTPRKKEPTISKKEFDALKDRVEELTQALELLKLPVTPSASMPPAIRTIFIRAIQSEISKWSGKSVARMDNIRIIVDYLGFEPSEVGL